MIIRNVVSKKEMGLTTKIDAQILEAGVPKLVRFANEKELNALLETGTFELSYAPPPAVTDASKIIPPRTPAKDVKASAEDAETATEDQASAVQRDSASVVQQTPEGAGDITVSCPKCGGKMVLVSDSNRPNVDIFWCTQCEIEKVIGEVPSTTSAENTPKKRVYSRCPKCERRKAEAANYCKKCTASEGQQPETD